MTVNQIYELVNDVTGEVLGESAVTVEEDLSNVVDIGTAVFNANAVDNYVRSLVNHIGRVVFVNRPYSGGAPSVLMDSWEYGSVMEKISAELPEATENESWELEDGVSYDPNIFYKPNISAKFFNKRVTFEIPCSFTERQVKESFSGPAQLNAFYSMIYNAIDRSMTVKLDALVMRAINNMAAETFYSEADGAEPSAFGGVRAVNLLLEFNGVSGLELNPDEAILNPEFIRYAAYRMGLYQSRMSKMSTLFNIGGKPRFTPDDLLHVVMLTDFKRAANVYLQSDTFHNEFTRFPNAEEVPFWQGSGEAYEFSETSTISVTTASNHAVTLTGILCVMFDRAALGVTNLSRRVTTQYNAKAEFFNNWYKFDAGYFNDTDENFVVFYMA